MSALFFSRQVLYAKSVIYIIEQHMQLQQSRPINDKYSIVQSQLLGKGSTGNVYLGFLIPAPQVRVAIKAINLREVDNEVTRYLLSCEIAALSNLGKIQHSAHENVVRLLDVVIQENYIYLVTELLEGGTLAQYLKRTPNGMPEEEAVLIFRQILEGYRQIRSKSIVHRDLKPDNVLFKTRPEVSKRVAVIDFGYCEMAEVPNKPQMFYNVGSPKYMAPEAYVDNLYSEKSDVWALGVIFYEMLVGRTCDQGLKMDAYLQMIRKNGIPLPINLTHFAKNVLTKMLSYNHNIRTDCLQILKEFENYQTAFQGHDSQGHFRTSQFNETANQFYGLRTNKNNQVFKSALLGQPSLPTHLLQSQIMPGIVLLEPPTAMPQQERILNQQDKKLLKSNSNRNVTRQIAFNIASVPAVTRVQNLNTRNKSIGKRMVEVKSFQPNLQHVHINPLDTSLPGKKVYFNVVPPHQNHNRQQIHIHNVTTLEGHPHPQVLQQQKFMSNNQADQNSIKISIKPAGQRYTGMPRQGMLSREKVSDNRIFHSPTKRLPSGKVQFYTEKKIRDSEQAQKIRHFQVRPFTGEIKRGPMVGLVPLFH